MRVLWDQAIPFPRFVEEASRNRSQWEGLYRTANIPSWAVTAARDRAGSARLLVIAEDWCGDASRTVPLLARLGQEANCLEVRMIRRDEHPELMDRYLTNGSRSIPIAIALDDELNEIGHWGPRPRELQEWVMANRDRMPRNHILRETRRWYEQDRGETTLREVLALFEPRGR